MTAVLQSKPVSITAAESHQKHHVVIVGGGFGGLYAAQMTIITPAIE